MEELTSLERRLVLTALWGVRHRIEKHVARLGTSDAEPAHEREVIDALHNAARKVGGDPSRDLYGAV
jgi:hypothetical protein